MNSFLRLLIPALVFIFLSPDLKAQKLAHTAFVSGLSSPIDIKNCGDNRLFIAERGGRIKVVNGDGTLRPTAFLDISSKISSVGCEEGFLGMAFSPNHKTDRKLYVNYTANISSQLYTIIEEYKANSTDSNICDASSIELLRIVQPACNHNGGNMMFGKDGFLYINLGDGGGAGDPSNNGQNKASLLGKMLRLDISNSSIAQPFVIPSSNPFYNDATPGIRKEIWAYGLRNPFRASVDRITGDIWIGDVGQSSFEEIDFQPSTSAGGVNYGWKIMEGNACYSPSTGCNTTGLKLPIYDYGRSNGYSVTGGYVHRSVQSKFFFSMYLFSDYGQKWVDGFRQVNGSISGTVQRFIPGSAMAAGPIGYGEDIYGDLYICLNNISTVYKLSDTSYLRRPKAYFTPVQQSGSNYILQGLRGRNVTYQWMKDGNPIPAETSPDYTATSGGIYQLEVTNDLGRKDTSDPFSLTVLPISLIDFHAKRLMQGNVQVKWKTGSEQNSAGFMLETKRENEQSFRSLAFIPSKAVNGNSGSELEYIFEDASAIKTEKIFYRLRFVYLDNSFSYSDIRVVSKVNGKGYAIFPNPAFDNLVIDLSGFDLPVRMTVHDMAGKLVMQEILTSSQNSIDVSRLKGVYNVLLYYKGTRIGSERIIVR